MLLGTVGRLMVQSNEDERVVEREGYCITFLSIYSR